MNHQRKIAVCLVSGGMDSCVCATLAAQNYQLAFFHANYGQRTQHKELACFHALADYFKASARLVVDFEHLKVIGGTSLLSNGPSVPTSPIQDNQSIPSTYVPFRNGLLLATAAAWSEVLGASRIFFGAVEQDSSGYPDCRIEFVTAMNSAIRAGTKPGNEVIIEVPLISKSKMQIVHLAQQLGAPLELTWSCYQAEEKSMWQM